MKPVRDPNGNELKLVLLQVMERGEQGPTLCRVRYDHETVQLQGTPEVQREFLMVWTPVHSVLGELRLGDIAGDLVKAREEMDVVRRDVTTVTNESKWLRTQLEKAIAELDEKTEALRELQKERDPERFERAVQERAAELQAKLDQVGSAGAAEVAALRSRVAELEASKRKLRDALDRAKERK